MDRRWLAALITIALGLGLGIREGVGQGASAYGILIGVVIWVSILTFVAWLTIKALDRWQQ